MCDEIFSTLHRMHVLIQAKTNQFSNLLCCLQPCHAGCQAISIYKQAIHIVRGVVSSLFKCIMLLSVESNFMVCFFTTYVICIA